MKKLWWKFTYTLDARRLCGPYGVPLLPWRTAWNLAEYSWNNLRENQE